MYADDTLVYISGKNLNDVVEKLNEDLENINKLEKNATKTKYMILKNKFKKSNTTNIKIYNDNNEINSTEIVNP